MKGSGWSVAQAPTAAGGQAQGVEDTALALTWAQFAVAGADAKPGTLQVEITSLPVDGRLQLQQADGSWAAVAVGERFMRTRSQGVGGEDVVKA